LDLIKHMRLQQSILMPQNGSNVTKALETDEVWIFYGGIENQAEIGGVGIKVDKESGEIDKFILPSPTNLHC
jgi:hypothetical protein